MSREKTVTLADRYRDPCDMCGRDMSQSSCRNIHCSANAHYMGSPIAAKPKQGPGKPGRLRPGEALRRVFQERRREEAHWSQAKRTRRWAWPM